MRKRAFAMTALIALSTFFLIRPPMARAAGADDLWSDLARATDFRLASGFTADDAYVRSSLTDSDAFPNTDYGVPLTKAEAAEVDRRIAVQLADDPVIEWASARPDFGGAYMDQPAGGVLVLLVTSDPASFGEDMATRLPEKAAVQIISVKNTRSSLEDVKTRIWGDRDALAKEGIDLQSASLDIRNNQVLVEVTGLTKEASSLLASRYGPVAAVENAVAEADACNNNADCAPMKGGLKIYVTGHPTVWCTSGFNVREGATTMRVLTAGHCLSKAPGGVGAGWSHHGVQFGTGHTSTWAAGANADAGLISQGAIAGDDNRMFGINSGDIRSVRGWIAVSGQNVGDYLCRSGATSGFWCGNITLEDRTKDVDGHSIDHQWVVNFDAIPGDSGAPYFTTSVGVTTAWGIHSDSTSADPPGGSAWYSPIPWVQSTLQAAGHAITFCTDPTCGL